MEFIWVLIVLGGILRWIADSWPVENAYPVVPLVLLALGTASAVQGTDKAARAGSAVFWLLALVYSAVMLAGVGEIEFKGIENSLTKADGGTIIVFLVPVLAAYVPELRDKLSCRWMIAIGAFAIAIAVLVAGGLSTAVAESTAAPLYDWVQGLNLFDTIQRFETIVAVALTMGWFALLNFLLSTAGTFAEGVVHGSYKRGVEICGIVVALSSLLPMWLREDVLVAGCVIIWGVVPVMNMWLNKNLKFLKNNA